MNRKIFIAGGLASLLIVVAVQEETLNQCANFGNTCNVNLKHSCCDESLKCAWSNSATEYQCINRAILGGNCSTNEDCSYVMHSTCSEGICVCRRNNIRINETRCMPLLNEFCWKELCAPENSECLDNECQCRIGFSAVGNGRCVENVLLGAPCSDNEACSMIKFATCASNGTCACSGKTVMIGPMVCSLLLRDTCESNSECRVPNSECLDQKCQCRVKYIHVSRVECKNAFIGMLCVDSDFCHDNIENTRCVGHKCECKWDYHSKNNSSCVLPLQCDGDSDCKLKNSKCIDNECQCKLDYILQERKCLPKHLGGLCEASSDCINIDYAVCKLGECSCQVGFFPINRSQCGRGLKTECFSDKDCLIINSQCVQKKCRCHDGYAQSLRKLCLPQYLSGFCSNDFECNLIPNAFCSKNNQCVCRNGAKQSSSACAPSLNQSCSTNQCITPNSVCIDNVCQCREGYVSKSNDECTLKYPEKSCAVDADCIDVSNTKCSDENKCVCKSYYVRSDKFRCTLQLEAYCQQKGDCIINDLECFDGSCQCPKGFFQISDNFCARGFIGQYCSADKNCNMIRNGKCSEENMCTCKPGYAKFDSLVCLPLTGEYCNEHKDCYVHNSNCVSNKCQCLEDHMPLSNTECLSKYVDLSCYTNLDCNEVINSHCSRFARCICNDNYMVDKKGFCGPILNGRCSENVRCQIANSQCINYKCQCKNNFVRGIYNDCVPTRLEEYCVSNQDCSTIKSSQCTENKCVCKKNHEMVDKTACKPLLNGSCNIHEDCIVENSGCIDNKCQCNSNCIMQSLNRCEPKVLGQTCETDSDCSFIQQGKCSPDNICVCSPKTFVQNNKTCSSFLNGPCQLNECNIKFSLCVDSTCQCKPGYSAASPSQCMNSTLLEPCKEDLDCLEPWHFKCSKDKKCVCKDNNVAVGNSTCLPLLGGICWQDDQCTAKNSYCSDYHCHCKPDFIHVASNKCEPNF